MDSVAGGTKLAAKISMQVSAFKFPVVFWFFLWEIIIIVTLPYCE